MKISKLFTSIISPVQVEYLSPLSPEEVLNKLQYNSEPENYLNPFRDFTSSKMYGGGVSGNKFYLIPRKFFFQSLTPSIAGSVNWSRDNTAAINTEFTCQTGVFSVFVLLFAWIASVVWICLDFKIFELIFQEIIILIYILFNLTHYAITTQCYSDLGKLFEAEPVNF